jgi:hypothetical protein
VRSGSARPRSGRRPASSLPRARNPFPWASVSAWAGAGPRGGFLEPPFRWPPSPRGPGRALAAASLRSARRCPVVAAAAHARDRRHVTVPPLLRGALIVRWHARALRPTGWRRRGLAPLLRRDDPPRPFLRLRMRPERRARFAVARVQAPALVLQRSPRAAAAGASAGAPREPRSARRANASGTRAPFRAISRRGRGAGGRRPGAERSMPGGRRPRRATSAAEPAPRRAPSGGGAIHELRAPFAISCAGGHRRSLLRRRAPPWAQRTYLPASFAASAACGARGHRRAYVSRRRRPSSPREPWSISILAAPHSASQLAGSFSSAFT